MSYEQRTADLDTGIAKHINRGWNRYILRMLALTIVYAAVWLRVNQIPDDDGSPMLQATAVLAIVMLGITITTRKSYDIYALIAADPDMASTRRTLNALQFALVAEAVLHAAVATAAIFRLAT